MREFSHKGLYPFVTDRPLQDYNPKNRGILSILNLEIGDLQKKRILEIGGGGGAALEEAVKLGLDWHYCDPLLKFNADDYSDPLIKKYQNKVRELQKDPRFRSRIKVKLAANLDYPDRSFDLVLSALAVPMYCRSPAEAEASIRQMIRVARQMVVFYTPGFQKDFEDNETPIGFSTGRKFHLKFALKSLLQNLETTGLIKFYFNQPSWAEKDAIVIKIFI